MPAKIELWLPITAEWAAGEQQPPLLSTCSLHINSWCGKERCILVGPRCSGAWKIILSLVGKSSEAAQDRIKKEFEE